jgi:hypothetical protein
MRLVVLFVVLLLIGLNLKAQIVFVEENHVLNGAGQFNLDMDKDSVVDYIFDVYPLGNNQTAARVLPQGTNKILDNSTYGYADPLDSNTVVNGYFHSSTGVLGTFTGAGQFSGVGIKYLGVQLNIGGNNHFGWIKLKCNSSNDTLQVYSFAYQSQAGDSIKAGQQVTTASGISVFDEEVITVYPNPTKDVIVLNRGRNNTGKYVLYHSNGKQISSGNISTILDVSNLEKGMYFIYLLDEGANYSVAKFIKE